MAVLNFVFPMENPAIAFFSTFYINLLLDKNADQLFGHLPKKRLKLSAIFLLLIFNCKGPSAFQNKGRDIVKYSVTLSQRCFWAAPGYANSAKKLSLGEWWVVNGEWWVVSGKCDNIKALSSCLHLLLWHREEGDSGLYQPHMCNDCTFLRCTKSVTTPDVLRLYLSQSYQGVQTPDVPWLYISPMCLDCTFLRYKKKEVCTNPRCAIIVPFSDVPRVFQPQMCHFLPFSDVPRCTNTRCALFVHFSDVP